MEKTIEQRAAICFCWKVRFNTTKTFEMIQKVYGESAVHRATVFRWYNAFSEGQELICDEQRSRRPTSTRLRENIAHVADILNEGRQSSCRLIAERMRIPKIIVQQILREHLQKRKLCAQFAPHALTAKQKKQYLNHTDYLIEAMKSDPNFLGSNYW